MRKCWFLIMVLACAGLLVTSGILVASDFPDEIVIDGKNYKKDIKGPVKFNHYKHVADIGIDCTECHHEYKDGKNVWEAGNDVKNCDQCHDPNKSEGNKKKLMMAFHNNCKNCHKEKNKEGSNAPDKNCEGCHQEQSKK